MKEQILQAVDDLLNKIVEGENIDDTNVYASTVGYVDRNFINISENEIKNKPNNWLIINNEGEVFNPLPGGNFENELNLHIVGITKAGVIHENLDTAMNLLQRDIFLAMLKDETLGRLCDYVMPSLILTVDEMEHPYGGFAFYFKITYSFNKINI